MHVPSDSLQHFKILFGISWNYKLIITKEKIMKHKTRLFQNSYSMPNVQKVFTAFSHFKKAKDGWTSSSLNIWVLGRMPVHLYAQLGRYSFWRNSCFSLSKHARKIKRKLKETKCKEIRKYCGALKTNSVMLSEMKNHFCLKNWILIHKI